MEIITWVNIASKQAHLRCMRYADNIEEYRLQHPFISKVVLSDKYYFNEYDFLVLFL